MQTFIHYVTLATPLFIPVLIGYALIRRGRRPKEVSDALSRFVFAVALSALPFHMMSDHSALRISSPYHLQTESLNRGLF